MKTTTLITKIVTTTMVSALVLVSVATAAKKNPTSKLYVADLEGQSEIDTGERIEDLAKKSVHNAQGTVIQTMEDSNNAMVFSNGTGVFLDTNTRMEVKRFSQEPFSPDRSDLETEPSISRTAAFIPRGTVGLCTPKLVAGSTMNYATPIGGVSIRSSKVVIEANDNETKISLVEGDVTVKGGPADASGQTLRGGQQAIIRQLPGQAPVIQIQDIPEDEMEFVEDKVTLACNARKTVFFDVAEKKEIGNGPDSDSVEIGTDTDGDQDDDGDEGDGSDNPDASSDDNDLSAGSGFDSSGDGWANIFDEGDDNDAGDDPSDVEFVAVEVTDLTQAQEATPVSNDSVTTGNGSG
ncbi:hypothetical protein [Synoicihabitans lomoniglobus]|uniref:FecR protein domain-containing protein n=1 Tax=Synoicihabitans lomoniglobus TaxID=2909285 RepID=A0AAF0I3I5_9BACT|nr:hypothetical protein [Opitutaceae bacterium LMO-M01]WED67137.1 hypothetical protein PXH66_09765 [Opitutaceae bacterium LMO-M01]